MTLDGMPGGMMEMRISIYSGSIWVWIPSSQLR